MTKKTTKPAFNRAKRDTIEINLGTGQVWIGKLRVGQRFASEDEDSLVIEHAPGARTTIWKTPRSIVG